MISPAGLLAIAEELATRIAVKPFPSVTTALILLASSCSPQTEKLHAAPFGVFLGVETEKLWHDVETRYGRSVRTERSTELGANAEAVVTEDGTPVIRIQESAAPTEVRIAH